jgi:thymidylate synthase (methanogen type)
MEIIAKNILEAWKTTLKVIMKNGEDFIDRDKRVCRELLNVILIIESTKDIEEPINVMKRFKDFIYPNIDEIKSIMLNKIDPSGYNYSYGQRLFNYRNAKNQIDNFIYPLLKSNPNSRRGIAIIYDPLVDSLKNKKSVPGLISVYFKVYKSKLDITVNIRSNDFFIGWPANIYQIYALQKYLADKLKIPIGKITVFSDSAHIFHEHFDKINEILG